MRARRVGSVAVLSAAVLTVSVTGAPLPAATAAAPTAAATPVTVPGSDWPAYERNAQHSSASFGDPTITAANAGHLTSKWTFTLPGPTRSGQPVGMLSSSPTVVGGRVYVGSGTGVFYALDASTGRVVWQRMLDYGTTARCAAGARGIAATATVANDPVTGAPTVYAAGAHYLYALDPKTGAQRWRSPVGPNGALSSGTYYNWSSPTVVAGRIFMGVSSDCESFHVRAGAVSLDQHTGALRYTYYAMPVGSTGASIWSSPASDGTSVWVTTGDPSVTSPAVGDSYAIVRLDAATMTKRDIWRTSDPASSDTDFGSSPSLWPATVGGAVTNLVGACNKNGLFYAWRRDRLSGGPVWQRQVGGVAAPGDSMCLTTAAWDYLGKRLFIASNTTSIGGTTVGGALRSVDPATGGNVWEQPLDCVPLGSPTVNGTTALVAVPTYRCPSGLSPSVQIFDEVTGTPLARIPATSPVFSQPVFAEGMLLVGSAGSFGAGGGSISAYTP